MGGGERDVSTTPVLPDGLVAYFAARIAAEADRVDAVLGAMTKRERALVREVAVMADVRATMRAGSQERVPPDSEVIRDTISACLHMDDLYPTVSRLERVAMRRTQADEETP